MPGDPAATVSADTSDRLGRQERVSILSWNPGEARGCMSAVGSLLLGPWHKVTLQEASTHLNSDGFAEAFYLLPAPPRLCTFVHQAHTRERHHRAGYLHRRGARVLSWRDRLPEARAAGYCEDVAVPKIQQTLAELVTVTPQDKMSPAPPALKEIGVDVVPVVSQVYQDIPEVQVVSTCFHRN